MLCRSVGVVATCALVANALILPPGVAPASNEAPDLAVSVANPKSQRIVLPCSECAFPTRQEKVEDAAEGDDNLFWIQGGANSVVFDFTISEDGKTLQLGGETIYPINIENIDSMARKIYVNQIPSSASEAEVMAGDRSTPLEVTASGMSISGEQPVSPKGDVIVPVKWQTLALENQFMNLDAVEITLLKTGDGELLIMSLQNIPIPDAPFKGFAPSPGFNEIEENLPYPPPPPMEFGVHKDCKMLPAPLCKFKNIVEEKLDNIRHGKPPKHGKGKFGGCGGRKGHGTKLPTHIKPHLDFDDKEDGARQYHSHPHHMRPHGPHHGHRARFLRAFVKGLVAVLIPVLGGVAVGLTVSVMGLIVGRLIGFLWIQFVRGGRPGHASIAQQEIVVEEGEDKGLVAEMEAPPVYEEAPAYEEVEKE